MEQLIILIPILQVIFALIITINFIHFLLEDRFVSRPVFMKIMEVWLVLIAPICFRLSIDDAEQNDCCSWTPVFSPDHKLGIYLLIALSILVYFYSSFRTKISTPILELIINITLIQFLILNVLIAIHINTDASAAVFGDSVIYLSSF